VLAVDTVGEVEGIGIAVIGPLPLTSNSMAQSLPRRVAFADGDRIVQASFSFGSKASILLWR
jgi:hypothetical protein